MIPFRLMKNASLTLTMSLMVSSFAFAKVTMNAMCFMSEKETAAHPFNPTSGEISEDPTLKNNPTNVSPEDIQQKYRIASLSKVLTTHWAVAQLNPEYRFTTRIYITPGSNQNSCNIHIEGDMDPYMGREMLDRIFSQLKPNLEQAKCTNIESISYDEFFPVFLDVMTHQTVHKLGWENPALYFNSSKTKEDFSAFIKIKSGLKVNPEKIGLLSKTSFEEYLKTTPHKIFHVKSLPLFVMAKDINKYSFNYAANVLFEKLGGKTGYSNFIYQRLGLASKDLEIYNGSGYPAYINQQKKYNIVTCAALVTIIKDLDQTLDNYKGSRHFQLADVMATGGTNETYSTFKGLYSGGTFNNTLVAKTGSAERAITFGGMLSTADSDLFFAVLTSPDTYEKPDLTNSRLYIRSLVQTLAERNKLRKFEYKQAGDMQSTDEYSKMELEVEVAEEVKAKATEVLK